MMCSLLSVLSLSLLLGANVIGAEPDYTPKELRFLNETEFARMPPLFDYDLYDLCIYRPAGVYCTTKFELVSDEPSELYDLIREYSSYRKFNYNHTVLQYGICLTETCADFYKDKTTQGRKHALERCLNETFHKKYNLGTRVVEPTWCMTANDPWDIDWGDIAVAVVCLVLLGMNAVGSLYEFLCKSEKNQQGNKFLLCFSVQGNLKRLLSPTPDAKQERLKSLYGLRSITTILVIFVHAMLPFNNAADNTHYFEGMYQNKAFQILINGTCVVQTFFIMSGLLLVYGLEQTEEKRSVSWIMVPKGILIRWMRLTPAYAVVLAITATWLRNAGSGPFWNTFVTVEALDCRKDWWTNLLYVNNYIDRTSCMPQTWYLAGDFQLTIVGLMAYVLVPKAWRMLAFGLLFLVGLITPALQTYLNDLDAWLIISPEAARGIFTTDPTFNLAYKRGHTNIVCYAMGLELGLLLHRWQRQGDFQFHKYIRNRYLYWAIFPYLLLLCLLGDIFFSHTYPLIVRAIYSSLVRPLFGIGVCVLIVGNVFKYERLYRGILEWRVWPIMSRLVYCAYCLHILVMRGLGGSRTTLVHTSIVQGAEVLAATLIITFTLAVPLWLFVEAPFSQLIRIVVGGRREENSRNVEGKENLAVIDVTELGKESDFTKVHIPSNGRVR